MKNRKRAASSRKKSKSSFQQHRGSVAAICVILALLFGVLGMNSVSMFAKNSDYKRQEAELQKQIDEQKERAQEIADYQEYVKTDEYIKDIAEEKLGMVDPNEIIFKSEE